MHHHEGTDQSKSDRARERRERARGRDREERGKGDVMSVIDGKVTGCRATITRDRAGEIIESKQG